MTTAAPLCSLVVPLFNKEQTIRSCLESIQAQTISSLEILVIDDGSTDNSAAIVEEFARDDTRVVLIREPNGGPASARNIGLETAIGTYVCFLDADDRLAPGFLEVLIAVMQREHTDVARCAQLFIEDLSEEGGEQQHIRRAGDHDRTVPGSELYCRLFAELEVSLMSANSALYRRDFLRRHRLSFNESLRHLEDVLFVARLYACDARVAFSSQALYIYQHQGERSLSEERHGLITALAPFVAALERLESSNTIATTERQARLHYCAIVALTAIAGPVPKDNINLYRNFLRSEVVVRIIAVLQPKYLPNSLLVARGLARLDYPHLLNAYCASLGQARRFRKILRHSPQA
ncbi:MAG: glycosyltransferase [Actinomycetia bacterium]|nr:glycosyltransferase [Actinomycetes bacterium]